MKHKLSEMSNEELLALRETADEATVQAINAELEKREANDGNTEEPAEEPVDEEAKLDAMLKECQANVGHKCKIVPTGTIEWAEGIIVGCIKVKRSNSVAYAIKLENGKRVIKTHGAPLFEILDEIVDDVKVSRNARTKQDPWSDERMKEEVDKYIGNVGRAITFKDANDETVTARIVGIVPVKRSNSVLYRVAVPAPTESNPNAVVYVHKSVVNTKNFTVLDADEESTAFNEKYLSHRDELFNKPQLSGRERVIDLELKLEKAKETAAKAEARIAALNEALEAARAKAEKEAEADESNML